MDFSQLKKSSQATDFSALKSKMTDTGGGGYDDGAENWWKPDVDSSGNGYAIIRFLPAPPNEDLPYVQVWDHGFQGPGGWYIEKSLTTIGQKDPVSEMNSRLWNSGDESDKDIVRSRKRRLSYYSNILIVSDPKRPENEGKVFLYKYGKKIFTKLQDLINPAFEDETPINPFDMWTGANFRLKIRQVEGYRNYDKSEFDSPSEIEGGDERLEAIWKQEHSLKEFIDPNSFKSYSELEAKLHRVLGIEDAGRGTASAMEETTVDEYVNPNKVAEAATETAAPAPDMPAVETTNVTEASSEDADLDYFKKLAETA